jgi:hypothetical protein
VEPRFLGYAGVARILFDDELCVKETRRDKLNAWPESLLHDGLL